MTTKNGTYHLSPTFDHAASLGRNESIEKKSQRLMSKDRGQKVETYVKKSKSYFYLKDNRLTKGTMKLVDEVEFKKLLSTLKQCLNLSLYISQLLFSSTHPFFILVGSEFILYTTNSKIFCCSV
mgnify:CR=1 FL=1